ncbi:MAG: hypothetical protein JWP95_2043, partial [Actinotalea sp.]|nr:hypothetical protein [Actinotalea sp.]
MTQQLPPSPAPPAFGPPPDQGSYASPSPGPQDRPVLQPLPARWAWVRPFVLRALVACLIAAALVGAVSALAGQFGPVAWRTLSTIVMVVVVSLLIWYDAEVSARRSDGFGVASLAVSGFLVIVGLVEIWWPRELVVGGRVHGLGTWLVVVLIARVALLHIHLLLNVYRRFPTPGMRSLARVTFGLVALLAVLLAFTLVADFAVPDGYWRVVAAVAILDGTGTILIPLVHTLFYKERMPAAARPPEPYGHAGGVFHHDVGRLHGPAPQQHLHAPSRPAVPAESWSRSQHAAPTSGGPFAPPGRFPAPKQSAIGPAAHPAAFAPPAQ